VPVASSLVAYGRIHYNPLFMVGGLIFLPFMPLLLGIPFGAFDRDGRLVAQSALAALMVTFLVAAVAAGVALFSDSPIMFDKFPPLAAGGFFSLVIAIAAALATADDAGHRQLIGLAAASQLALIPAWLGISLVLGFTESPLEKFMAFGLNAVAMLVGGVLVYAVLRWRAPRTVRRTR
jgi:hypothetical protein